MRVTEHDSAVLRSRNVADPTGLIPVITSITDRSELSSYARIRVDSDNLTSLLDLCPERVVSRQQLHAGVNTIAAITKTDHQSTCV
jgi:hypothetical protein